MKKTTTVQAPDRNFADLEAHANLCRYICNLTSHARCHGGSKIGWGSSNPPHDDAISSHVYETKGFLSAEEPTTSAATPTHTVTLGVIDSKRFKGHENKVNPQENSKPQRRKNTAKDQTR